jgi:hypothetical protein
MKNISEIKEKLIVWRDSGQIDHLIKKLPEAAGFSEGHKETTKNASLMFINKLIKHLDSKRPGKSSISDLIMRSFNKLWNAGGDDKIRSCFIAVVRETINNNFHGAFSGRLNVKSQEFMDLEDCEPF